MVVVCLAVVTFSLRIHPVAFSLKIHAVSFSKKEERNSQLMKTMEDVFFKIIFF